MHTPIQKENQTCYNMLFSLKNELPQLVDSPVRFSARSYYQEILNFFVQICLDLQI